MTRSDTAFVPGRALARLLYEEAVRPILAEEHPGMPHAAALLGAGSEVLGFDTARSTDHDWGPRLLLFLTPQDVTAHGARLHRVLAERLPKHVRGWPTHFRQVDERVGHLEPTDGPVEHRVLVLDPGSWSTGHLGFDATSAEPTVRDWLAVPQQRLAEITEGEVFHDGLSTLTTVRARLAWYPDQVWRYLVACQWQRISQEEAFVGRCAEAGDDLGSAVVAGRLVRDLMRLSLLLERRYAPYGKWLGSAFGQLAVAEALTPSLRGALAATEYHRREKHLCDAYSTVATLHNETGLTSPPATTCRPYHGRPYQVLFAERFANATAETVTDPQLRTLPRIGNVDQWADSTDLLGAQELGRAVVDALP
ncbi:DUF4037 domain-containing protein [Streptacidiphilus jiangxiensis]|uniref:DUF4037 domain-containing protein n=1 Tax=Streptacidiphilus jiangxiensis TaxID=235985 RepID=UPI0005AA31F3|nr:DUF4037 domain-containing protein [Streptacidiphilus jiangxiensis]